MVKGAALLISLFALAAPGAAQDGLYVDPELFQDSVKKPKARKPKKPRARAEPTVLERLRAIAAKVGIDSTADPPKPNGSATEVDSKFSGLLSASPRERRMDSFWRLVEESKDGWRQAAPSGLKKPDGDDRQLMLSITGKGSWKTFIAMGVGLDSDYSAGPVEAEIREADNGKKYLKFVLPDAVPGSKLACDSTYWCRGRLAQPDDLYCRIKTTCAGLSKETIHSRHFERLRK